MRLLESFTRGKSGTENLDRLVVTDRFAAVFDGATPKHDDVAGATRATRMLVDALMGTVATAPPGCTLDSLLDSLTDAARPLRSAYRPSAAGAIYSASSREVVVVGDSWVAIDGDAQFHGHRFEQLMAQVRRAITEAALASGRAADELRVEDPGRAAILPLLRREHELRNVDASGDFFFAALDGTPMPARHLTRIAVPLAAHRLCLATDGYPRLGADLRESEAALEDELRSDPLRIGPHGGTKAVPSAGGSFDDRTLVLLDVTAASRL